MSQRTEEAVGRENTEEGTDQRRTDVHTDSFLVTFAERGHGHHDTQYRRDDTETGHGIGDTVDRVRRMLQIFFQAEQFHVEQAFKLMGGHVAGGHDAQVITDVRGHALIFEHGRVLGEDRAGGCIFNVAFNRHHAFATALVEDLVDQAQHLQIEGVSETRTEHPQGFLEDMQRHVTGVGLEECAEGCTTNDHDLERLNQGGNFAVGEYVSAEHAREYDNDADDFSHSRRVLIESGSRSYSEVNKTLLLLIGKTAPDYSPIRR